MPTNLSFDFDPFLGFTTSIVLAAIVVLLAFTAIWLRRPGAWVRLLAAVALALALFNPILLREERDPVKSVVAVIADRSQSQDIGDRAQATTEAVEHLKEQLSRNRQFEVRVVEAGRTGNEEDHVETRLFGALQSAFRDIEPSRIGGAVMITDGQIHDVPENLNGFPAPLHALITGDKNEADQRIEFVSAPRFGIVGKQLQLSYRVLGQGVGDGPGEVRVSVNGEFVSVESAAPGVETPLDITVPSAGRNIVELVLGGSDGELTETNNRAIAIVDGIRENLRVLLVSGEPHSGERTWRNLLKSDASVDLVHFTILRPPEKQDGTPINELSLIAFPTRELFVEKIDDFDLIIFDRYQHRDVLPILYYDYIAQYVEDGGALLVAAGPEYASQRSIARTPLLSALPGLPTGEVTERAFYPRLSDLGTRHPVTRSLEGSEAEPPSWSRWFRSIGIEQPKGSVVMEAGDGKPLLILNRVSDGRVGMLLSDHGWLWARGFEGGGPHVSLYRRLAHWLMKEPELEEERLTAEGRGMTLSVTRQTMSTDPGEVSIVTPSGAISRMPLTESDPGEFEAEMEASEIGIHQVANGDLVTLAHVGPVNAPEFAATVSTTGRIEPVANKTGGIVRRIADGRLPSVVPIRNVANASGRDWIGFKTTDASILRSVDRTPLFGGFLGFGILILAIGSMWYREGR